MHHAFPVKKTAAGAAMQGRPLLQRFFDQGGPLGPKELMGAPRGPLGPLGERITSILLAQDKNNHDMAASGWAQGPGPRALGPLDRAQGPGPLDLAQGPGPLDQRACRPAALCDSCALWDSDPWWDRGALLARATGLPRGTLCLHSAGDGPNLSGLWLLQLGDWAG